jgi:hypothetical protein
VRWIPPFLFIVAAAWVWRHNAESTEQFLVLPGMGFFVGADDPVRQGDLSVRVLSGFGGILLLVELWRGWWARAEEE